MKSKKKPSKGLGDTIEKVTKFTGLKAAVESIFGEDCGCSERKEKLVGKDDDEPIQLYHITISLHIQKTS